MDDTANPAAGSESPAFDNPESAFEHLLTRQAAAEAGDGERQPDAGADDGQPDEGDAPADDAAEEQEEQRFKVKINGEEREVPLSELLKGYSLESDYRVKTSRLAEEARAAQAQYQQAQAMQQQYAQVLQQHQTQLAQMMPQPPDPSLIQSDPVAFLQQQQAYQSWQVQMQRVQQEQYQLTQQQQAQQQAMRAESATRAADVLKAEISGWEPGNELDVKLSDYAEKHSFDRAALVDVITANPKAGVILHKAMLYDQLMAKQGETSKKLAAVPPKPPQRPGTGTAPTDGRTRAMQNLKRTGSIDAGAEAFMRILGG